MSLQVLGPSSVGLLVQRLAWTVWRQVTHHWTDEVYGSFQCCSFRFLESSAQVGLSIDQLDDSRLARGAATGIVAMHLHAERGGMMSRGLTYLDH